jgi:hypothetical protein
MITTAAALPEAAERLGWHTDVVGPVDFGGTRFWAAVSVDRTRDHVGQSGALQLVGCLFVGAPTTALTEAASLLAAYTPRAVVVDGSQDLTDLMMEAAVLDQGVVAVVGRDSVEVLARPGPRVSTGPISSRERALLTCVYRAWTRKETAAGSLVTPTR